MNDIIEQDNDALEPLREKVRVMLEEQRRQTGISGNDEEGNYCIFHPDGSKTILVPKSP